MDGTTLTIEGASVTGDAISMTLPEPFAGWVAGAQIVLNESSEGECSYIGGGAQTFTSTLPGANFTVEIIYVLPESGGVVVGTFGGSLIGSDGTGGISITQGTFQLVVN